jgi:hypothetical protein
MRRMLFAVAAVLGGLVSAALFAAGPASAASPERVSEVGRADDNATVCNNARKAVESGGKDISNDLRHAAEQVRQGDKKGADATVKATAPKFNNLDDQLQQVANTASDNRLKTAVSGLGSEFGKIGSSVSDVQSLRNLDQAGLQSKGREVAQLCGFNRSSSPSSSPGGGASRSPVADGVPDLGR